MPRTAPILASGLGLAGAVIACGVLLSSSVSSASRVVTTQYATLAVASFTPAAETTHNRLGSSVCGTFQASEPTSENHGDLNAAKGSFLARVNLPDRAVVRQLVLFANDFDADGDAHVYLVRKLLQARLSPQFGGYRVMAQTASAGAVLNTMRRFADTTITRATIDNAHYEYFLEVVNCANVEPFAAQIAFTR